MKIEEIKGLAKELGVKVGKLKKAELVRSVQQAENNEPCFETGRVAVCGQDACLWREDCQ